MRILFTGASAFTGYWFIKALYSAGHLVVAITRKPFEEYADNRRQRISFLGDLCDLRFSVNYGSSEFLKIVDEGFDLFCHHAADVTDYKSPNFNPIKALENNCHPIIPVISRLKSAGCKKILLTGSVFEPGEGVGSDHLRAVSPYGLSKGLTSEVFRYYSQVLEMHLGKFVIPNPFGPYEELRFTSFLIKNWFENRSAHVSMPLDVRDNIPVTLLAKAYVKFAENLCSSFSKINPSCYPESQGAFTQRFAKEMNMRLNLPCDFTLAKEQEFPEPKVRINSDILDHKALGWHEESFWNELAEYYQSKFALVAVS